VGNRHGRPVDSIIADRHDRVYSIFFACPRTEFYQNIQITPNYDIPDLVRKIRSLRDREKVPGILHKGLVAALETGNNLSLPKEDFTFIIEDVAEEVAEELVAECLIL